MEREQYIECNALNLRNSLVCVNFNRKKISLSLISTEFQSKSYLLRNKNYNWKHNKNTVAILKCLKLWFDAILLGCSLVIEVLNRNLRKFKQASYHIMIGICTLILSGNTFWQNFMGIGDRFPN